MIPHPAQLDAALGSQVWEPLCRVTFYAPDGSPLLSNDVSSGDLTVTAGEWPREQATIVMPTALTPESTAPPVSPFGGSVRLSMGARIAGTEYLFTRSTLDVYRTSVSRPEGTITVEAVSHEARVNENRYASSDVTPAGKASDIVIGMVRAVLGANHPVRNTLTTDVVFPAGAFPLNGDAWPIIESIMDATGGEAVFDPTGALWLRDDPVKAAPVLTLRVGSDNAPGGTLTGYESVRGWGFNRVVVVYSENTAPPQQRRYGIWDDTSATTGITSPYGKHTRVDEVTVEPGKLPSQADANRAAATIARRARGRYRTTLLRHQPAPWLDPGDTITVGLLGGATEDMQVLTMRVPLSQMEVQETEARDYLYTA